LKELGLDVSLLVSQAVNFALLVLLLDILLYKPIRKKLQERSERIRKGLEDAEAAEKAASEADLHYQQEIERARRESRDIIERASRAAEQQRQEILAQARGEAHELIVRAQHQANREIQEGQIALREQIIDLAFAASSRLIQTNLDDPEHHRLIGEFIREAEQSS